MKIHSKSYRRRYSILLLFLGLAIVQSSLAVIDPLSLIPALNVLSGAAFFGTIEKLGLQPPTFTAKPDTARVSGFGAVAAMAQDGPPFPFRFANLFTNQVTFDSTVQDIEPSVMAQTVLGTDYTVVGYMREFHYPFEDFPRYSNWRAVKQTGASDYTRTEMLIPLGYTESADPMLATDMSGFSNWNYRIYMAGLLWQGASTITPNSIVVWKADVPYTSWINPVNVYTNNDTNRFTDKPDIDVSQHQGTAGNVYVSNTLVNNSNPNVNELWVARSTDGGDTFTNFNVTAGYLNASQILVSPVNGRVYVLWVDYLNDRIKMSQSDDQGANWTAPEEAASGDFLGGPTGDTNLNGGVRTLTVLQARYNAISARIGVVWHAWADAFHSNSDIYFVSKTQTGWEPKRQIAQFADNDQFQPAIDYDFNGNWMVNFYDRHNDPNNILYEEWWVRLQPNGTIIESNIVIGGVPSDPVDNPRRWVGDYQDIWFWNYNDLWANRFNLVFAQGETPPGGSPHKGDIYLSGVR